MTPSSTLLVSTLRSSRMFPRCAIWRRSCVLTPPSSGRVVSRHQRPVRLTHAGTGVPPPHTPAAHFSFAVHALRSLQAAPFWSGVHTDGEPVHEKHGSISQRLLQPSPSFVLPSSPSQRAAVIAAVFGKVPTAPPMPRATKRVPPGRTTPSRPASPVTRTENTPLFTSMVPVSGAGPEGVGTVTVSA